MTETGSAADMHDPVGWRGIVYGTPVVLADGQRAGVVREVLGSDAEDIFHGIRLELADSRRQVLVPADDLPILTRREIRCTLTLSELNALPDVHETETYHLASVGWLRRHLGWKQDSTSDEEAG